MCESTGGEKAIAILVIVGIVCVFLIPVLVLVARARGDRLAVVAVALGAVALGAALPFLGDIGEGFLWRWGIAIVLAGAAGLALGALRRRRQPSLTIAGLLGAIAPPVVTFVVAFALLVVTETCFD